MKTQFFFRSEVDGRPAHVKAQQEREARRHLAESMAYVLRLPPANRVRWRGTKTDLMEAVHTTWLQGILLDSQGRYATLADLCALACAKLGVALPRNPRSNVRKAERRKGIRQTTLGERYTRLMFHDKRKDPIRVFIEHI